MTQPGGTQFFGHPRGLMTLFFTEMWERFSYYGMRAILTLFMTTAAVEGGLGLPPSKAGPVYAMYTSLVYLMTVPGGWIADNVLGQRKSVLYGGIVIMVGHILLALTGMTAFYSGLACVVLGTGLLKPNISVIVGQLYSQEDARRDAGFSIFYMGINLGAFASPLVCGYLAQSDHFRGVLEGWGMDPTGSWHWGFAAAAVGMFFGLVQYVATGHHLGDAGLRPGGATPERRPAIRRTLAIGVGGSVIALAALAWFDSTARYVTEASWTAAPDHEYSVAGHAASGAELELQGGAWVSGDTISDAVGADVLSRIEGAVEGGATTGEVGGLSVTTGGLGTKKTIESVTWTAQRVWTYSLRGSLTEAGDAIEFAPESERVSASGMTGLIGEAKMAEVEAAVAEGRTSGTLSDVSLKVGGLNGDNIHDGYTIALLLIVILFFARLLFLGKWTRAEHARLVTIFVLFCGAAVFWGMFEQAGSTLTLFAERSTDNSLFGHEYPSSWWQSANAIMIVILAPFFAWLWVRLGKRNPSDPAKFAVGILFAGLGFLVLVGGAMGAGGWQRVTPLWLLTVYLLHTIGELWLSPVGLSSMTKLAPARVVGLMMGVWFLAASVGNFISGSVAGFYEDLPLANLFGYIAAAAGVMAFVMFLLVGPIRRMLARSEEPEASAEG